MAQPDAGQEWDSGNRVAFEGEAKRGDDLSAHLAPDGMCYPVVAQGNKLLSAASLPLNNSANYSRKTFLSGGFFFYS